VLANGSGVTYETVVTESIVVTLQTAGEVVLKVTGKPDEAVAFRTVGAPPKNRDAG
jgi:hypothetical protein